MPAKSQDQRELLNARFGHQWVKAHGFDNKGKLPAHVKGKHMAKQPPFDGRAKKIAPFVGKAPKVKPKVTEDSPGWNARTMGNKTGWQNGVYYNSGRPINYGRGASSGPPRFPKGEGMTAQPGPLTGGNRITEDDPRWNPKTMGNKRGHLPSSVRKGRTYPN